MEQYKTYLRRLIDRRVSTIRDRGEKVKRRYIDRLSETEPGDRADREWLEQYAKGNGLDIACGDFPIGDGIGVDGDPNQTIGADLFFEGDELTFQEPGKLDFIVTNYLDGFSTPLKALNEWWRCLRPGGVIAIVCRDANQYSTSKGPLDNGHRQVLYTEKTLAQYLYRAGFKHVSVTTNISTKALRGMGIK